MKIAGIFFNTKLEKLVIDGLMSLPEHIVPTMYSADEVGRSSAKELGNGEFLEFKKKCTTGYFLYSVNATYDISLSEKGKSSVFMEIGEEQPQEDVLQFVKTLSKVGIEFGFAAENKEYMHRNRHHCVLSNNRIETWVGRELDKYCLLYTSDAADE